VKVVTPTEWDKVVTSEEGLYEVESDQSVTMLVTANQAVNRPSIPRCGSTYW
jgi:hypothetical protein